MALEYAVVFEDTDDEEACTEWLQKGYEPFAVDKGVMYFRSQFWNEDSEPQSSTKPENKNLAGNEPDVREAKKSDRSRGTGRKRKNNAGK